MRAFLVGRFFTPLQVAYAAGNSVPERSSTAMAIERWRPRMLGGAFFDALSSAIDRNASQFSGIFDLALTKAKEAHTAAEKAYDVAESVRVALGEAIAKARNDGIGRPFEVLKADLPADQRSKIAKIWDSHDEYIGEAVGDQADGLGVLRTYALSEVLTPSVRSSFAGHHESGNYGPLGVFTFPDQSQFAGEWSSGHPSFGYREYLGGSVKLACDFYLGAMHGLPNHLQPLWRPHGEGIAVDAAARRVRCGKLIDGEFDRIVFEFDF